jgi:plastocyanin
MLKYINVLKLIAACFCVTSTNWNIVHANDIIITVTDQTGENLEGAVIYIERTDGKSIKQQQDESIKIIDQKGEAFFPFVTALSLGDKLEFHNTDPITHHVYSFSKVKPINIIVPARQNSEAFVFKEQGVVALGCNIHDHMAAFIYIAPSPIKAVSDKNGKATFTSLPKGDYTISYWHHRVPRSKTKSQQVSIHDNTEVNIKMSIRRDNRRSKGRQRDERPY